MRKLPSGKFQASYVGPDQTPTSSTPCVLAFPKTTKITPTERSRKPPEREAWPRSAWGAIAGVGPLDAIAAAMGHVEECDR